jgi:hypothetical protein
MSSGLEPTTFGLGRRMPYKSREGAYQYGTSVTVLVDVEGSNRARGEDRWLVWPRINVRRRNRSNTNNREVHKASRFIIHNLFELTGFNNNYIRLFNCLTAEMKPIIRKNWDNVSYQNKVHIFVYMRLSCGFQ